MKFEPSPAAGDPASADALAARGEADYKAGNRSAAAGWLDKALAADRRHARANWLLGNLSQDEGQLDRAITCYRRALRADPLLADAHNDLGTAYFAKGWHVEAEQCYRQALELRPDHFAAAENLAAALRAQGKLREARDAFVLALKLRVAGAFRRLLRRKPRQAAQPAAADAAAAQRIAQRSSPDRLVALGNQLAEGRDYAQAIEAYQRALMLDPGHGAATANIARVLHELGHYREAEEVHRASLEKDPDLAGAHSNFASTLLSLGRNAEAESAARKALGLNPRSVHAKVMLGNALVEQGRLAEGQALMQKAERDEPGSAQVLRWLGMYEMVFNADFGRAEALLRRAQVLAPQDTNIRINLARCLLIRERFAEGWEEYEWRRRDPARAHVYARLPYRDWNGEPLDGKAVAVNGEQGLGDEIMFASCLGEVASRARRTVLYCNRRLEPLFRRSFPSVQVAGGSHVDAADPFPVLEGIDCQIAAGSLPRTFRRSAADFPAHNGYLRADDGKEAAWRSRLAALGPGLKVGLSWKGGTPLSDATRRTLALDQLEPLFRVPGIRWVSLQYGDTAAEREAFAARAGTDLAHWQDAVDDLDETAALMSALDLRISVCNTQVHLSGALGKEVWVIAPLSPDWRYGHAGDTMLWYPAARMYRQGTFGRWDDVIERLAKALAGRG